MGDSTTTRWFNIFGKTFNPGSPEQGHLRS